MTKVTIGSKQYTAKLLTGDFPIKFYKETGFDIFKLEEGFDNPIEVYEIILNLAYHLFNDGETFDEFSSNFTPYDLVTAYASILECYTKTTKSEVVSKGEKK